MTTGVVIFAVGDTAIDYVVMATWSAPRIKRHLGLPTTLITDRDITDPAFDQVIKINGLSGQRARWFNDLDQVVPWNNLDRCDAFDLSPYDRTLLLDADYVVNSSQLLTVVDQDRLWCHRYAYSVGTGKTVNHFGRHQHPMYWATVIAFGRNAESAWIFDSMRMIRDNWQHYRDLYHIDNSLFRNDYALSIALPLVNGHMQPRSLPGFMLNVMPEHRLQQIEEDSFEVTWRCSEGRLRTNLLESYDFHAMCKRDLGAIVASH